MESRVAVFWLSCLILLFNQENVLAQTRRSFRTGAAQPRALGSNPRSSHSSSVDFNCPEEFGYYPHPTDCSQYYVCVFGGALLESCTGGLMYSHELQTCDWPRNVGCDAPALSAPSAPARSAVTPRVPQVLSRIRFSSAPSAPSAPSGPSGPSAPSGPSGPSGPEPSAPARIQQVHSLPPPLPPANINPVITTRGQPKNSPQEDIAKLYEEAHDTLPPVEEEESSRPQRIYRGQPSTVTQVQRDRDGILQQPSVNAIPTQAKVGSFAYSAQPQPFRVETSSPAPSRYVPEQPQKPVLQNNKNYYNTSNYDPSGYDSYYAVYDDDVELYRDVEYQPQYNQNNQQSSQQPQRPVVSSTYRPTVVTTIAPTSQREQSSYVTSPRTTYQQRPSYQDYDDALVSQLEDDRYNPKQTHTQLRNELNSISDRPILVSSTIRTFNSPKYQTAFVTSPEPFSLPSTTTTRTTTTTRFTTTTTTPAPPQYYTTRGSSNSNSNRNRGNQQYITETQSTVSANRGTHPPRARPTLKPAQNIVSKAQEFIDIYRNPPSRPEPLYPQPTPDKTAAKCRKDVCLLPDCYCGGKDIPGELPVEQVPQIVLLTFDDSVNDLNKQLYQDLFERGRVNPNGCPISATFYVSHEWTDYSQVQNLYADGHEMASHTVSHSFGEAFSPKKWAREIAGQREILSAYGGVKLEDVRGMRAPFLSIGGNKMFKMLHDFNFTYDSSMPVYENRPPSWPYTLDYKIFHDCMIPPCPTKSYPGVWEVPMVMWQDLNGGRCSMGDACSNPADAENVNKMIMKNFERHYTTNRAPFGLYYHAAWFTQPHHKEGFIQFLDTINSMKDVWIITNWQALQWVRDPTPLSRVNSFQPFQCNYSDRPKRCNNPKVCNLWHKSGVRYMRTCQPCPEIYPWTGKTGIRSSRIDNDIEVADTN